MRKQILFDPNPGESSLTTIETIQPHIPIRRIQSEQPIQDNYLATVILEATHDDQYDNQMRLDILKSVVSTLATDHPNDGIIVFPAGMFFTNLNPPSSIYSPIEPAISQYLATLKSHIIVCFGIDGSIDFDGYARDQIAVAIDRTGIIALGKKFYPAKAERGHVNLAGNFNIIENGKSRIFTLGKSSFYLGMCYDGFGIKNQNIKNPGVTGFIELAHCFYPKGQGPSGESYFARHGFAGTAREWNCPVYGTAVFFKREVPEHWPTGVIWNQGSISTTKWNYSLNPLKPVKIMRMNVADGAAVIRLFQL